LLLLLAAAWAYWVVLAVVRAPVIHWLYKGQYDAYADLLLVVGLWPFASSTYVIFGSVLKALERPDFIFRSYVVASLVTLTVGIALIVCWGTTGAIWGQTLGAITTSMVMVWYSSKADRGSKG